MNTKTRMLMTLLAVVLTFGLFSLERPTSAQSTNSRGWSGPRRSSAQSTSEPSPNSNCKKLKGIRIDVFDPAAGTAFGTITNGGILNGTTADVINFNAGFVFTPDPNVVTWLSDLTITTIDGQLKTSAVNTGNIVTPVFTEFGNINPDTSTGRFAGATGVIFLNGRPLSPPPQFDPFEGEITCEICFAQ